MYCLGTIAAVFLGFAVYQIFWGTRDLRLAARLKRGEAVPIGAATRGAMRIVVGEALAARGVHGLRDGEPRAWVRGRLAHVIDDGTSRGRRTRILLEHEPGPLCIADASGTAEVLPKRAHDALPRAAFDELEPDGLPPPLERALRDTGLEGSLSKALRKAAFAETSPDETEDELDVGAPPPAPSAQLWYEENAFRAGERLYVVGRVTQPAAASEGGAYRGRGTSARIEDAIVSVGTPAGLARPYRSRGWMLILGGLILGSLGAAMLSAALRTL